MKIDLDKVKLIKAEKNNELHKKAMFNIFNENVKYFHTSKPISYENHCNWWETAFEREHMYIALYEAEICGYYRLNKEKLENTDKNLISWTIAKKYQGYGIGNCAFNLFVKEMKKIGISEMVGYPKLDNKRILMMLLKNDFVIEHDSQIKFVKKL